MAVGLPELIDIIGIVWDIITSTYEPLNAGETFTARPFAYVDGVYTYVSDTNATYYNQPAYFEYYDGSFFIMGKGEGPFTVSANKGDFNVGVSVSGVYKWLVFRMKSGQDTYFNVSRSSSYTDTYGEVSAIYIGGYAYSVTRHLYNSEISDPFQAFYTDSGFTRIGNVSGGPGDKWYEVIDDYVPLYPGYSYTYYEALDIYINYFNNKYSDLNLTREDFPPESDYLPQEPTTEPVGSDGFNIDYGEIMSPSEFNDVLNSAEYDLEEIPTTFALDLPELPEETLPAGMFSLASSVTNMSLEFFENLGLSGILIATGVIVCVIRLLRGR